MTPGEFTGRSMRSDYRFRPREGIRNHRLEFGGVCGDRRRGFGHSQSANIWSSWRRVSSPVRSLPPRMLMYQTSTKENAMAVKAIISGHGGQPSEKEC